MALQRKLPGAKCIVPTDTSEHPILSFTIPTYNRSAYLRVLLSSLLEELRGDSRVEVIVSDNASTDDTPAVVQEMQERGLPLRYIRNEVNLGADANILQCYEQAKSKYVWIFGDDDMVAPDGLRRVLSTLDTQDYDLIAIRCYTYTGPYTGHCSFKHKDDLIFTRAEDLAWHVHVFFTFISAFIINKERVSSLAHPPFESLLNTSLIQLGPYFTAMNNHRRSLLIQDPLIAATGNETVAYNIFQVFGVNLTEVVRLWLHLPRAQNAILNGSIRIFFPQYLIRLRVLRQTNQSRLALSTLYTSLAPNPRLWFYAYLICALPLPALRIWTYVLRISNKFTKLTRLPW
jgi:glycosyltransferase involved in cell wall biosynthesis